jgi:hypothetical protein
MEGDTMGRRKRIVDENQLALPFDRQVALYAEVSQSILEHAEAACENAGYGGREDEDELYVGLAAACHEAIRRSGMSRAQVIKHVNTLFGRTGRKAKSENMLNNYLAESKEDRPPVWLVIGICVVTGSLGPLEYLVSRCGGVVISAAERTELLLGKLHGHMRAGRKLERELEQQLRLNRAAGPIKEAEHG